MVHLATDSRLLTNLLTHEKDYAKALHALLSPPPSHALSAYAAASPPPLSHGLLQVATALGSADEALGRYADAVEEGREVLRRVRDMEEEVKVVLRDREILVTRLIKASKSTKNLKGANNRDSVHVHHLTSNTTSPAASSVSLSSAFSSASPGNIPLPSHHANPKLTNAQAELQACEATLAQKERALVVGRTEALKEGLGIRLRAMVECGWVWGEMGKEALRALEKLEGYPQLNGSTTEHGHLPTDHQPQLPPSSIPTADDPQYYIPPAHAITDADTFPSTSTPHRHVLPRRITEEDLLRKEQDEDEAAGGSSIDEPEPTAVRVYDNPRLLKPATTQPQPHSSPFSLVGGHKRGQSTTSFTSTPSQSPKKGFLGRSATQRSPTKDKDKEGSGSGFFGSIRGLFGGGGSSSSSHPTYAAWYEGPEAGDDSGKGGGGGLFGRKGKGKAKKEWETRTDKNLRELGSEPLAPGPATEAYSYAHMRESVRGRGRVVSDSSAAAASSSGARKTKLPATKGNATDGEGSGDSSGPGGARKLRKGRSPTSPARRKSRSSSVPPPAISAPVLVLPSPSHATGTPGSLGSSPLFAGTEIERRYEAALGSTSTTPIRNQQSASPAPKPASSPSSSGPVLKRQKSARKPAPAFHPQQEETGVREGLTLTVVGSSQLGRRASLTQPPPPVPEGSGVSRNNSVRSAASAPPGVGADYRRNGNGKGKGKRGSVLEPGKQMPSLVSVVGDAARSAHRHSAPAKSQTQTQAQASSYPAVTTTSTGGSMHAHAHAGVAVQRSLEMALPRAPPRVDEILRERQEREREHAAPVLADVRAPVSVFDHIDGSAAPGASSSGGGSGGRASPASSEGGRRESRPAQTKSPLKSALRNPSRTPSPMPQLHLQPLLQVGSSSQVPRDPRPLLKGEVQDRRVSVVSNDSEDDEIFYEADDGTGAGDASPPSPAPPPPSPSPSPSLPQPNGHPVSAHEPRRRKSVRVSLNPTFSATPPAIEDEGEEEGGVGAQARMWASGSGSGSAAWGGHGAGAWNGNGHAYGGREAGAGAWGSMDMWEDSSEEDVEYARARSLLSLVGGKEKGKGKK
ncbi:hypothetical protein H0H87_002750 [Tephrocybe sp. NHM501043]|nr:hypothetical protein H0H87_002750 [Tephrocybe sp. NHM501043]